MESATTIRVRPARIQSARPRVVGASTWAGAAFAAMCALALAGWLAFPTYPTYDSLYALLWGRDLLHLHLPDLQVYRAPTEHPLAIAFGALCSIFGQGGARLVVLGSIGSFVALVAGVYRLGRLCFGPVVGAVAGLLALSALFVESLATQGYLDVSYTALVVWAAALEAGRSRRGWPVLALLCAAGLLRPEAWLLGGAYWLWCTWPARPARSSTARSPVAPALTAESPGRWARAGAAPSRLALAGQLGLAMLAPLVWMGLDAALTGDPLYSLRSTSGAARALGRTEGFSEVLASTWSYAVRIDRLAVVLGAIAGALLALRLAPRRAVLPLALLASLLVAFLVEGALGAPVVNRYMLGAAVAMLPFGAFAVGGWSMLERGSSPRRAWMAAAAVLVVFGALQAAATFSLLSLRDTLAHHEDFHQGLATALRSPAVARSLKRCPLLSLPDNKLIPDARWILGSVEERDVVARSQARADALAGHGELQRRIRAGSVAVYPLGAAVFYEAVADAGDDPRDQVPPAGFKRIYTSRYYAVYANC